MINFQSKASKKYFNFLCIFALVFLASFLALYGLGLVPDQISSGNAPADYVKLGLYTGTDNTYSQTQSPLSTNTNTPAKVGPLPVKIVIPNAGVDISVSDPNTTDNSILDQYLTEGAVRYPGSGYLGVGNLFLFGHSSTLAVVHNPAYRTFNNINTLQAGDEIDVYSTSTKYIYKVRTEQMVEADKEEVNLSAPQNMLTISTCDLLGSTKEDRYVVQADYVSQESL